MLSYRAFGVYAYLRLTGAQISAENLSKHGKEGEKALRTALNELRSHNLLSTTLEVVNGRVFTVNRLLDADYWPAETGGQIQLSQLNSNLPSAYSYISKKEYIRERMEEPTMSDYEPSPMWLDPEERAEYVKKQRAKRDAEYRARRDAQAEERIIEKRGKEPIDWTADDSSYHFAERMALTWHIKPWRTARTRFKAAMGKSRKLHGTTGDIELKMMDRFFETLEHHRHIDEPEMIWKMFIKQFEALHIDVMRATVTDEDIAKARAVSDEQWRDLDV